MISEQLLSSISEIETHNELLSIFFPSILKNIYELLIQNESNPNIYESDIKTENLRICQDYLKENLPDFISLNHYNYHDLNLINSDWKKAHKFNILLICQYIENKIIKMPPPFVVLKIDGLKLNKYLNDEDTTDISFANMRLPIITNNRHKIKVCRYKKNGYYYIIMFFDSLNYNETHVFSNHDVIMNINVYDNLGKKKSRNWFTKLFSKR